MASIAELGNLNSTDPIDLDVYPETKDKTFGIPPRGEYVVMAPDEFPDEAFGATAQNYLKAQVDPTIVGPTNEGYTIRFTRLSAKPWERDGVIMSQISQYLQACGFKGACPGDPSGLVDAIRQTAGTTYKVYGDWRAYNKRTGQEIKGMKNFPLLPNGEHQAWVDDEEDLDEQGRPKRIWANFEVRRFLPESV